MLSGSSRIVLGLIATVLVSVFVLGVAQSISTGFAGFWGGLPFWIVSALVFALAVYDYWDECLSRK